MFPKIGLVGAGNIGGTLAFLLALQEIGDIILLDQEEGVARGKSLDIQQSLCLMGSNVKVTGSANYKDLENANVIVVTAGVPRKAGMSRDDLLAINTKVMQEVGWEIKKYAPHAFVIVVTNPLDAMVSVMQEATQFLPQKVVGMAGVLDSARMRTFLAEELNISSEDITTFVLGGHGDTMVPLSQYTTVNGIPLANFVEKGFLSQKRLDEIIQRTRSGGGEIVGLLKTGSAFYAPAVSVFTMIKTYLNDTKKLLPCAAWCQGEYGLNDIYVGVPVIIGQQGVESIIEVPLTDTEKKLFEISVQSVRDLVKEVKNLMK